MSFGVKVKFTGTETLKKREVNARIRDAMVAVADEWRSAFLAKRFTQAGAREYGFTERRPGYTRRKFKKFGHRNPLVFSGEGRQEAISVRQITATATSTRGASVRIQLPRKYNFQNPRSATRPVDEIRAVSAGEIAVLRQYLVTTLERLLGQGGGTVVVET